MLLDQTAALRQCIRLHQDTLAALAPYADAVQYALDHDDLSALIAIYHAVYPLLEQEIWNGQAFHSTLDLYQSLFREQEALIQHAGNEQRYDFILSIPVADRPQHVKRCLESIYQQCVSYGYGGRSNGRFSLVRISIRLFALFGLKQMNDAFQAVPGRADTHQYPLVSACEYVRIKRIVVMQQFIEQINTAGFRRFSLHIQAQLLIEVRRAGVRQVHFVVTVYMRMGTQDMADQAAVRTHMAQ